MEIPKEDSGFSACFSLLMYLRLASEGPNCQTCKKRRVSQPSEGQCADKPARSFSPGWPIAPSFLTF